MKIFKVFLATISFSACVAASSKNRVEFKFPPTSDSFLKTIELMHTTRFGMGDKFPKPKYKVMGDPRVVEALDHLHFKGTGSEPTMALVDPDLLFELVRAMAPYKDLEKELQNPKSGITILLRKAFDGIKKEPQERERNSLIREITRYAGDKDIIEHTIAITGMR